MPEIHFECPKCSQPIDATGELAGQLVECPTCKETIEVPSRSHPAPPPVATPPPATETTFFQGGGITVTKARFVVRSQTFAMRGITSVDQVRIPPSYQLPYLIMGFGVIFAVVGFGVSPSVAPAVFGIVLLATGGWLCPRLKPTFAVVLRTAGGEVTAYKSKDREFIWKVIQAITDSIVARG